MMRLSNPILRRLSEVTAMPDLPGERYTLEERLGEGGMGTVYAAYDDALDREVAVKVAHTRDDGALAERLRQEARVLARLEHPGIVPVHDVGLLRDGRIFYVMKRVRGLTLRDSARALPDTDRRLNVFERICETVAFAHQHGVVHRDLKPDNVMVGAFGEVLVLDWGVAKLLRAAQTEQPAPPNSAALAGHTQAGTVLGTPGFMAPEQAQGGPVDQRADVYALGAILYELIAGETPAQNGALAELQRRRDLPRRLRAICALALAAAPAARYASAAELADDIARYRAGQPVRAYHETIFDRIERLFAIYRTPILLVLAYLVMRAAIALFAAR
jgi:serine/threonine protein kinase